MIPAARGERVACRFSDAADLAALCGDMYAAGMFLAHARPSRLLWAAMVVLGCGRGTIAAGAGADTGSTAEHGTGDGSDSGTGEDGTATGATGGETATPSSSSPTDTAATDVTDTGTGEWVEGEFEGLYYWYFEGVPSLSVCEEELHACLEWAAAPYECGGLYLRVRGSLSPKGEYCQGHMGSTSPYLLVVSEILEARACEPSDCNGDPPCDAEPAHCWQVQCDPTRTDCPGGTRCAVAPSKFEVLSSVTCVPLADPAAELDAPCTLSADENDRRVDDCGVGLQCWNEDLAATSGVCVQLCLVGDPDSPCPGECQVCSWSEDVGVCLPADCDGSPCSTGTVCAWS